MNHTSDIYESVQVLYSSVVIQTSEMKSIFLTCVAFCVLSVLTKDASCKSLSTRERQSIISSKDNDNETSKVSSNKINTLVSDKVFRTKRDIVKNAGCPINMRRVVTCVPIRQLRHGRHSKRKHGLHKNKSI